MGFSIPDDRIDQVKQPLALGLGKLLDLLEPSQGLLVEGGQLPFPDQIVPGHLKSVGNIFGPLARRLALPFSILE